MRGSNGKDDSDDLGCYRRDSRKIRRHPIFESKGQRFVISCCQGCVDFAAVIVIDDCTREIPARVNR